MNKCCGDTNIYNLDGSVNQVLTSNDFDNLYIRQKDIGTVIFGKDEKTVLETGLPFCMHDEEFGNDDFENGHINLKGENHSRMSLLSNSGSIVGEIEFDVCSYMGIFKYVITSEGKMFITNMPYKSEPIENFGRAAKVW